MTGDRGNDSEKSEIGPPVISNNVSRGDNDWFFSRLWQETWLQPELWEAGVKDILTLLFDRLVYVRLVNASQV